MGVVFTFAHFIYFGFRPLFFNSFNPTQLTLVSSSQGSCRAWLPTGWKPAHMGPALRLLGLCAGLISLLLHLCSRASGTAVRATVTEGPRF